MTTPDPRWHDRLFVAFQHLLPQHLLSSLMYRLTRVEWRPFKALLIGGFIRAFDIRMEEAAESDPSAYPSFNALFTRALRPEARPLDPAPEAVLSPVDGTVSQIGSIRDGMLIQAKGHGYSVRDLLGGPPDAGRSFDGGAFATIYLSPRDYHRIHMPLAGTLTEMIHIPGRLFSVNAATTALVPGLFARNERVACLFSGDAGPMAVVLVGAIFVGGIETVWHGEVTPSASRGAIQRWRYDAASIRLERGAEMGRFNMGSTVILLFPRGAVTWDQGLAAGDQVRIGQRIGSRGRPGSAARDETESLGSK